MRSRSSSQCRREFVTATRWPPGAARARSRRGRDRCPPRGRASTPRRPCRTRRPRTAATATSPTRASIPRCASARPSAPSWSTVDDARAPSSSRSRAASSPAPHADLEHPLRRDLGDRARRATSSASTPSTLLPTDRVARRRGSPRSRTPARTSVGSSSRAASSRRRRSASPGRRAAPACRRARRSRSRRRRRTRRPRGSARPRSGPRRTRAAARARASGRSTASSGRSRGPR